MLEKVKTIQQLSERSWVSEVDINNILASKRAIVELIKIKKKWWWVREVFKINSDTYINLLRYLNKEISRLFLYNNHIHGFIKGRGIISNAKEHLDKKIVVNLDIKDFFNSIQYKDIESALTSVGLETSIIPVILELVTINEMLPTGFPTSPTISNIICIELDNDFIWYAKKNWYKYTRYWDDITLSTDTNNFLHRLDLIWILQKYRFILNDKKYKIQKRWWNRYVTGLTVCEKNNPRVPKYIKNKLRQETYYINKYWFEEHAKRIGWQKSFFQYGKLSVDWWIWYLQKLEPKLAKFLRDNLDEKMFESSPSEIQTEMIILK